MCRKRFRDPRAPASMTRSAWFTSKPSVPRRLGHPSRLRKGGFSPASKRGQDKHVFCRSAAIYYNYDILMS